MIDLGDGNLTDLVGYVDSMPDTATYRVNVGDGTSLLVGREELETLARHGMARMVANGPAHAFYLTDRGRTDLFGAALFDQFYVFVGPDGWAWCEMFLPAEHRHAVAPTPFRDVVAACEEIRRRNGPRVHVDVLTPDYDPTGYALAMGAARAGGILS